MNVLEKFITKISGQNIENMNRYTENMNMMVASLKEGFQKTEVSSPASPISQRTMKLTKTAKVPFWSCDRLMENFTKQLETWNEINEDIPEFVKFHYFIASLKTNKEIKGLP